MADLDRETLSWVCGLLGTDDVREVRGLRSGGTPWLIRFADRAVVLRFNSAELTSVERLGLRFAARSGVAVPEVLGADVARGLLLISAVGGTSRVPVDRPTARLRTLGAAAASLHAVPVPPAAGLQRRVRTVAGVDFAALRAEQEPYELLERASDAIGDAVPDEPDGLVHGDLWQGNVMWDGYRIVALIDWDCAGFGAAGVDLGSLRCDAATAFGSNAADDVLAGWEAAAGRPASHVAYWDVVAALCTPNDMGWFHGAIAGQGRADLNPRTDGRAPRSVPDGCARPAQRWLVTAGRCQSWMPHSVLDVPAQRPARRSSPGLMRRVHGPQPMEP